MGINVQKSDSTHVGSVVVPSLVDGVTGVGGDTNPHAVWVGYEVLSCSGRGVDGVGQEV